MGQHKLAAVKEEEENEGDVGGSQERYNAPRNLLDAGGYVDDCELPATTLAKQVKAAGQVSLMSMLYDSDDEDDGKGELEEKVDASPPNAIISFVAGTGAVSASSSKSGGDQGSVSSETKGGDDGGRGSATTSPSISPRRSSIFDFVAVRHLPFPIAP